jgi:oxalate decarboxylase
MAKDESERATQQDDLGAANEAPNGAAESNAGTGHTVSRRSFVEAAALAGAGLISSGALAQSREQTESGRKGDNASDPGPENAPLLAENPDSNKPPFTDTGNPGPTWYSFDITPKRLEAGGWTHQVTERELPPSKDLAGVNMRLTAGSFRELHWHLADEWAIMLAGKARVSVMQPNGKMFIDDIGNDDLWYFPAGMPHSIQGLEGEGCEFLLVFDQGNFSEDDTFLLSEFLAHVPPEIVQKNMGWSRQEWDQLPATQLYIFPAELPGPLEEDKRFLGSNLETENQYTFKMSKMAPTTTSSGGEVRVVDSGNFPVALNVAAAQVTLKPGAIRELHWHPNVSEWQYWIKGKGRMTIVTAEGKARTMDFNANDVGFVPTMAGHYIENTGTEDLVFLEMFKTAHYQDISLNEWIARMPDKMAQAHLKLPLPVIRRAPQTKNNCLPK